MPEQPTIFILNGPNLNLLGEREPEIYGRETLAEIGQMCAESAAEAGLQSVFRQSNHEGELVTWLQEARKKAAGVILNAGAYTHTSIAILDALRSVEVPVIEVHLTNPYRRESYRRKSHISPAATGVICGLGSHGYVLAVAALARMITARKGG
ncbi:MAG: type II 3-dehydroquinate dehydratase [Alphaproteobacteria bacterium]|nr:type II 3-dehydroquinate dehydratase [Alphaproteobacteria bacterium]